MELVSAIREKLRRIDSCEKCGKTDISFFDEDGELMAVFCNREQCQWSYGIDDTSDLIAKEDEEGINFDFKNVKTDSLFAESSSSRKSVDLAVCDFSLKNDEIKTPGQNCSLLKNSNSRKSVDLALYDFIPYEDKDTSNCCNSHELEFQLFDDENLSNSEVFFSEVKCFICNLEGVVFAKTASENFFSDEEEIFKLNESQAADDMESFCFFYCERCRNNKTDLFSPILNKLRDVTAVKCLVCENTFDTSQSLNSYQNVLKEYLSLEKPHANLTGVTSYDQIERGDHIAFMRTLNHVHHAIVTAVEPEQDFIEVIEWGDDELIESVFKGTEIKKSTIKNLFSEKIEKYEYEADVSYSAEDTARRAESRLGEKNYNPLENDCERFASWCKIGKEESSRNAHPVFTLLKALPPISKIYNAEGVTKIFKLLGLLRRFGYLSLPVWGSILMKIISSRQSYKKLCASQKQVKMSDEVFNNRVAELFSEFLTEIFIPTWYPFGSKPISKTVLRFVPNVFKNFNTKNKSSTAPTEESDED